MSTAPYKPNISSSKKKCSELWETEIHEEEILACGKLYSVAI